MVAIVNSSRTGAFLSVFLFSLLASVAQSTNNTHQPRPYTINVDRKFIEDTRFRVSRYRPTLDIDDPAPAWFDGPPTVNVTQVARYWANEFNFYRFQDEINKNFSHYMTTVPPPGGRYNRSLDIHFIHQVSKRRDAIPMILLHGWPSTNLEWAKVIPDLVNPPNSSLPAFHVVAPDLPGYGFSPAPTAPGMGSAEHAAAFASLMQQLGYDRYVLYSTDLGFAVAKHYVPNFADRIINHVTDFYVVFPNATDMQRFADNQTTPTETAYFNSINAYLNQHSAYASIHGTRPISLAHSLFDSPVGFLAWVWQVVYWASERLSLQSPEELIRRVLTLYIPGPYGNIRSYKELFPTILSDTPDLKTNVPTSVVQWGGNLPYPELNDAPHPPIEWVQRTANVTYFNRHPVGGHFPAESQPNLWIEDIWKIFANQSYQNHGVPVMTSQSAN